MRPGFNPRHQRKRKRKSRHKVRGFRGVGTGDK
jgi:hypothetical protein